MEKSESIKELAAALCLAQSKIQDATRDTQAHKYKYADLSQVLQIIRPVFSEHGLSLSQFPTGGGEHVSLDTILMHKSGEWLSSKFTMPVEVRNGVSKAQASGMVIAYMRRYAASAIAGITQEDDDAAAKRGQEEQKKIANEPKISIEQVTLLYPWVTVGDEAGNITGWSDRAGPIFDKYNIGRIEDLPQSKFEEVKQTLGA